MTTGPAETNMTQEAVTEGSRSIFLGTGQVDVQEHTGFVCPEGNVNHQMVRTVPILDKKFLPGENESSSISNNKGRPTGTRTPNKLRHGRQYVGVDGKWYDVTNFIDRHPGGNIILEYLNRDASGMFWCFHPHGTLNKWKPVATYNERELNDALTDPAEREFRALTKEFAEKGWYKPNYFWLARRIFWVFFCLTVVIYLATRCTSRVAHFVAAVFMAAFWQQSGFLMHDFMHNAFFQNRVWDQNFGMFFGSLCFGISSQWWRDEHFEHHLFTNTYVDGVGPADPQMKEDVWVQNEKLYPFAKMWLFTNVLVRFQHILYIPANMFVGRWAIQIDSYMEERRPKQWAAIITHWVLLFVLLSHFPTWKYALGWLYMAGCMQGILHLQLLVSHYDKPFVEKQDTKVHSYMRRQAAAVKDIINPWWMDWFHGGLNFHFVHHLWPKLPRSRYRAANEKVVALCEKYNIKVDRKHFFASQWDILVHLKRCSDEYRFEMTLDPR